MLDEERPLGVDRGPTGHQAVEDHRRAGQGLLLDGLGKSHEDLSKGALAEDDDQAGEPVADRDDVDPADVGESRLGRRRKPGDPVRGRERRRGEAEPLLRRVLDLPELVADHQLLDGGELTRVGDRLDEVAIPRVRRDATRARMRVGQQACHLELREGAFEPRAFAPDCRRGASGHLAARLLELDAQPQLHLAGGLVGEGQRDDLLLQRSDIVRRAGSTGRPVALRQSR